MGRELGHVAARQWLGKGTEALDAGAVDHENARLHTSTTVSHTVRAVAAAAAGAPSVRWGQISLPGVCPHAFCQSEPPEAPVAVLSCGTSSSRERHALPIDHDSAPSVPPSACRSPTDCTRST